MSGTHNEPRVRQQLTGGKSPSQQVTGANAAAADRDIKYFERELALQRPNQAKALAVMTRLAVGEAPDATRRHAGP
jgi:hypothetical protein